MTKVCVYCGDLATTKDHVVPYSFAGGLPSRLRKGGRDAGKTVPACHDCNSWLGSRMLLTVTERKKAIAESLPKRHAKLLASPAWDVNELLEVSKSLQAIIVRTAEQRAKIEKRIQWARHAPVREPESDVGR